MIEIGMLTKSMIFAEPPCAMLMNVENKTMTNTSSSEAPARISLENKEVQIWTPAHHNPLGPLERFGEGRFSVV